MNELPNRHHAESIDTFLEVLQARRSIRTGFLKDKPVPDALIEKILEAARLAPSAGNSQPWEFLVIRDLEIREKIVEIFKTQMRDKIEIEEAARGQRRRVNAGVDFRHAPVHVLVLGDPRTNDAYPMRTKLDKWEAHYFSSLANCVLQMLLPHSVPENGVCRGLLGCMSLKSLAPQTWASSRWLSGDSVKLTHWLNLGRAKTRRTRVE